jgi:hypothetical protein
MRVGSALALALACAACAPEPQPFAIASPAAPQDVEPAVCQSFTIATLEAGRTDLAHGEACLQTDGFWRIVHEEPSPAAAIARGSPIPPNGGAEVTVYYPYDPTESRSSFLTGGGYGGGYGYGGYGNGYWFGGFWYGGFHHHHHFRSW